MKLSEQCKSLAATRRVPAAPSETKAFPISAFWQPRSDKKEAVQDFPEKAMISNMISDFQSTTPGWRKLTHKISHLLPFTYRTLTLILEVPQIHSWVQNSIIDRFWSTFACRSKPQRRQVLGEDPKNQMQVKAVLIFQYVWWFCGETVSNTLGVFACFEELETFFCELRTLQNFWPPQGAALPGTWQQKHVAQRLKKRSGYPGTMSP